MAEAQKDVFPLGHGGGLLADILNFALNNLHQFGEKTAASTQKTSALFDQAKGGKIDDSLLKDLVAEAANVNPAAGVYRELGMLRQGGSLNPTQYAQALLEQPNYARFKQLIENIARRKLGEKFNVFRGHGASDPLFRAGVGGRLPNATAVSLDPEVAKSFGRQTIMDPRLTKLEATPESVLALLPKRGTGFEPEKELLIDPRWAKSIFSDPIPDIPSKFLPLVDRTPPVDLTEFIPATPPIPGAHTAKVGLPDLEALREGLKSLASMIK